MNTHLDLSYVISNITDDKTFIAELLNVFLENLDPDYQDLRKAAKASDHARVKKSAHKMKSSFRSLGMNELSDICQRIENSGVNKEPMNEINVQVELLGSHIPEVIAEVNAHLSSS